MTQISRSKLWKMLLTPTGAVASLMILFMGTSIARGMGGNTTSIPKDGPTPISAGTAALSTQYFPGQTGTPNVDAMAKYDAQGFVGFIAQANASSAPSVTCTPSLTLTIEESNDSVAWNTAPQCTPIALTSATTGVSNCASLGKFWRVKAVIGNSTCGGGLNAWTFTMKVFQREFALKPEASDVWFAMQWDPNSGAYCSPVMSRLTRRPDRMVGIVNYTPPKKA